MSGNMKREYSLPMTLEKHFEDLKTNNGIAINELFSLYKLLKKRLEDKLISSRSVFVNYSLHDASHSRSIIHAIERFLGEDRIRLLTPTDTFMLLICAYAHDYGMAQTFDKLYDILGSKEFETFLKEKEKDISFLEIEDAQAIKNLLDYLNDNKTQIPIQDIYWSIVLATQLYLRSDHWKGIVDLDNEFHGLFEGHLAGRFINGSEGIVEICMCHSKDFKEVLQLESIADGIVGDDFHPRFIAAMLRLGDLLDLDNNRFPLWFARAAAQNRSLIPQLSVLHYHKHNAVSHLLITDKRIAIRADCTSKNEGFETANLIYQWTSLLQRECLDLRLNWEQIAPEGFGMPPSEPNIKIFVNGKPFRSTSKKMQMQMSQERVMNLLEGTSIYRDKYVGIREVIQNAVDASLLKLWEDITQNVYLKYNLSKNDAISGLKLTDIVRGRWQSIFSDYDITVEVIKDMKEDQILIVVKDKGIGIALDDIDYIADIGSSKENNTRLRKLMEDMPAWMKPSGVFGIGLQSVFQLTDCIEFYTRQPNQPERRISLYSYGKSRGKIDVHDIPPNEDGMFYDNTTQGTNVKITIDPHKMMQSEAGGNHRNRFHFYDTEFDFGTDIDIAYAEICQVCKERIKSVKSDYFNIFYHEITTDKDGIDHKGKKKCLRRSYFLPSDDSNGNGSMPFRTFGESIQPLINSKGKSSYFIDNAAYHWDESTCRAYCLKVRPCEIRTIGNMKQVFLPDTTQNLYHVSYKFNEISNTETIYPPSCRTNHSHAGFLEWNILILDGDPTRYLNIDRDRLREGAISEQELLNIRGPLLENWCKHLSGLAQRNADRFAKSPGVLLSLILLFYQNVSAEQFQEFIKHYQENLNSMNLTIGREHIPVTCFWDREILFEAKLPLTEYYTPGDTAIPKAQVQTIQSETIRYFPRRMIQTMSIHINTEKTLIYRFRFEPNFVPYTIEMSESARVLDYFQVFDAYTDRPENIDFLSIQKKVFKPDHKYPHLVISCYPHTFKKGRNFASHLDDCIRWYILSPFDSDATKILKSSFENKQNACSVFVETVKKSDRFAKCVRYIMKKQNKRGSDQEKQSIVSEYENFISGLYNSLYNNSDLLVKQFKNEKRTLKRQEEPAKEPAIP